MLKLHNLVRRLIRSQGGSVVARNRRGRLVALIDRSFGRLYAKPMEIQLTPAQAAFLRQAIESGRIHHAEEAVQQALSLWETRERGRLDILSALNEAEGDLQTGNFSDYGDKSLPKLGEELKSEARASLKSSSKR